MFMTASQLPVVVIRWAILEHQSICRCVIGVYTFNRSHPQLFEAHLCILAFQLNQIYIDSISMKNDALLV